MGESLFKAATSSVALYHKKHKTSGSTYCVITKHGLFVETILCDDAVCASLTACVFCAREQHSVGGSKCLPLLLTTNQPHNRPSLVQNTLTSSSSSTFAGTSANTASATRAFSPPLRLPMVCGEGDTHTAVAVRHVRRRRDSTQCEGGTRSLQEIEQSCQLSSACPECLAALPPFNGTGEILCNQPKKTQKKFYAISPNPNPQQTCSGREPVRPSAPSACRTFSNCRLGSLRRATSDT